MSILHAKSPIYHTPHGRGILLSLLWPSVICGLIISACLIAGIQPAASLSMVVAAIIGGCLTGLVYIILLIRIYQRLART